MYIKNCVRQCCDKKCILDKRKFAKFSEKTLYADMAKKAKFTENTDMRKDKKRQSKEYSKA